VEDGEEATARKAFAAAAKGCVDMFQKLRMEWRNVTGSPIITNPVSTSIRRKTPRIVTPSSVLAK
jgi:hypothetical protein